MAKCALTTFDNPFDPFTQFDSWYQLDLDLSREQKRNDCCSYLDRIARTSDQLTEEENDREIERAIDEIIKYDFRNIYKKLTTE
ncbi:MAG: hypothetical protein IJ022_06250 [Burkholderiaceae bacterium]|nr:hypothetical protein [Burkholderiaceae bacterium]